MISSKRSLKNRELPMSAFDSQNRDRGDASEKIVYIHGNQFLRNEDCCLLFAETVSRLLIRVSRNRFMENLLNVYSEMTRNVQKVVITRNLFKPRADVIRKSIQIAKRFSNLIISENEFSKLSPNEESETWLQFFGCIKGQERPAEDWNEIEVFYNDPIAKESKRIKNSKSDYLYTH